MIIEGKTTVPAQASSGPGRTLPVENAMFAVMDRRSLTSVLLVDDEREICQLISSLFRRNGSECVIAHSIAEGRQALTEARYDAVFLDVNLPDGLGYDLIQEIKTRIPGTPCVAISALDNERERAVMAGADAFIPKPFSREMLMGCIRSLGFNA